LDVPLDQSVSAQAFRRDPEWLYGEGVGISRAPLVMIEFVLRSLRQNKLLHQLPLGVLYYQDEGRACEYSRDLIRKAAGRSKQVFVLRPGGSDDNIRVQRRGLRRFRFIVEGKMQRIGQSRKAPEILLWFNEKLGELSRLSSRKDRLAVSAVEVKTHTLPTQLPHRIEAVLTISYFQPETADRTEAAMKEILLKGNGPKRELKRISDRPSMRGGRHSQRLFKSLKTVADEWEIPLEQESSVIPTAGGLVPAEIPVICGIGPVARDLYTPNEAVNRSSIIQRTLLMAQYLVKETER
jgi:D-alanine-D-alanine ligase